MSCCAVWFGAFLKYYKNEEDIVNTMLFRLVTAQESIMDLITFPFRSLKTVLNSTFNEKEPWQIVTVTTSSVLMTVWLWEFLFQDESIYNRGKKCVFRFARLIPSIRQKLDTEMAKISDGFIHDVQERTKDIEYITILPDSGKKSDEVLDILNKNLNLGHYDWKNGRVSGSVYFYNQTLIDLITKVYGLASYTNPLHPDVFPGVCKMEAEVVKMSANLFRGGPDACGTMTTGGTESIIMACKAYRDYAKETRGVKKPEIIMPVTAHTGFDKAAQYLGLRIITVPVDPHTLKVDVQAMKRMISSRTIMLVGSAPNFPYGTMDDIESISELGLKYNIPVHVDACLGGFLIVFMEDAGYPIPPFDFRLPGVTSISADTHKYGFAPKGSSVILYREPKYRHCQFTVSTDWPGGVYGSPTVSGSRAGGIIATCWATFLHFGNEGYIQATRDIIHTTHYIEKQLRCIDGIFIFGKPATSVIAIGSKIFDIYRLSDSLGKLGWNLNVLQFPSGIHICVTHMHTQPGIADKFVTDVKREVSEIMKTPGHPIEGKMAIYGVAQQLADRRIVGDFTRLFLDSMYYTPKCDKQSNN